MFCKLKISSTSKNNQILKNYLISFEVCDPQVRNPRSSLSYIPNLIQPFREMHAPNKARREASNHFPIVRCVGEKEKKDSRELSEHRKVRHGTMCLVLSGPIELTSQTCRGYDRVSWWAKWHAPTCPLLPFSPHFSLPLSPPSIATPTTRRPFPTSSIK